LGQKRKKGGRKRKGKWPSGVQGGKRKTSVGGLFILGTITGKEGRKNGTMLADFTGNKP